MQHLTSGCSLIYKANKDIKTEKIMDNIQEGLKKLDSLDIPYAFNHDDDHESNSYVRLSSDFSDRLREVGFRVGRKIFGKAHIIYYKGRFFGLTTV